ncbi:ATP-dependent RNA helicase SUPV3L1/SUV3 [Hasllibacter halocynthiae]|uniref:ATP-dependent RNA helicase SUPV3L1/SUV3 n=1 Tax=Hasllibacter halocynthiae TaxID=595589 RepID=A0A2T0X754_9RHOB|nr:helicase-related protein [Hasllibacter halocynthiae]PRY94753.1 ATP-dependent RNA helicase SUPV3L1/SUV3 [Hasllibacter halocynthiae]
MSNPEGRVTAVLGPTNTGKTHYAIERMLAHGTGVIGLPLRLLAREVYDRCVAARGPNAVALVTGEERIVPARARYWVCTVEAMPMGQGHDFLAVDEIQLCADPERGHVFTDRLLHARGRHETLLLGADTMAPAIRALVPRAQFLRRERFSTLTYTGEKKISRMKPRSAIVGFSVENVYAIAELLRRQRGGAAVVMGALSPRTRNAQVEMYQAGEVDFLVATDAIGMGLNLDVDHVAFSSTRKFDGTRMRPLQPGELAQIAGRAGRHTANGTFGVTGEAAPLDPEVVEAIEESRFLPVRKLQWRSSDLRFGSVGALLASLQQRTENPWLSRTRDTDDLSALKALAEDAEVRRRVRAPADVRLLWDVCTIPDFRGIGPGEHAAILTTIFGHLGELGRVPDDWFARQVKRTDRVDGDIDTLSKRLAYVRTWTYVAQRAGWLDQGEHWRGETRAVEDRLSDALHEALTRRFVDRRTSVLLKRLKQKEAIVAEVNAEGEVIVEGQPLGRLEGFRFRPAKGGGDAGEAKAARQAAAQVVGPQIARLADRFYNAPDTEMDVTEQGGLMWGDQAVGKLVRGDDPLSPKVHPFVDDGAEAEVRDKVARRLQHFVDRRVAALFEPLIAMRKDEALTGLARGFAFRLVENLGVIPRGDVAREVKELGQEDRALLRRHKVRFGQFTVFVPDLLKPAPTRLRLVLWALSKGLDEFPEAPPPGLVTIPAEKGAAPGYYAMAGYRAAGERAVRIDMLERLADMIRGEDTRGGFEAKADMLSITGMTLEGFADLMRGLGYKAERGERPKLRAGRPPAERPGETPGERPGELPDVPTGPDRPDPMPEPAPGPDLPPTPAGPPGTMEAPAEPTADGDAAREDGGEAVDAARAEQAVEEEARGAAPAPGGPEEAAAGSQAGEGAAPSGGGAAVSDASTGSEAEAPAEAEREVFYTFTWAGSRPNRQGRRPQGQEKGRSQGRQAKGPKGKGAQGGKPKTYAAAPDRRSKDRIDPDNPFAAALAGLKK